MIFGQTVVHDTTIIVTIITTVGLIAVAIIGQRQVKATNGAKNEARENAEAASKSATVAKEYAAVIGAKDAHIASLESRLKFVEDQNKRLIVRLDEIERRDEEHHEQQRAASLLERDYAREIDDLRDRLHDLKNS